MAICLFRLSLSLKILPHLAHPILSPAFGIIFWSLEILSPVLGIILCSLDCEKANNGSGDRTRVGRAFSGFFIAAGPDVGVFCSDLSISTDLRISAGVRA